MINWRKKSFTMLQKLNSQNLNWYWIDMKLNNGEMNYLLGVRSSVAVEGAQRPDTSAERLCTVQFGGVRKGFESGRGPQVDIGRRLWVDLYRCGWQTELQVGNLWVHAHYALKAEDPGGLLLAVFILRPDSQVRFELMYHL